jgi:hypothetical protein
VGPPIPTPLGFEEKNTVNSDEYPTKKVKLSNKGQARNTFYLKRTNLPTK